MNCLDTVGDAKVTLCPLSSQFSQDAHDNTQTVKKAFFFFFSCCCFKQFSRHRRNSVGRTSGMFLLTRAGHHHQ